MRYAIRHLFSAAVIMVVCAGMSNSVSAAGEGATCGGIAGIQCDAGLWCDPRAAMCGGADIQGTCVRVPDVCATVMQPVCGCDKKTYSNDCERRRAKVAKAADGACN